MTGTGEGVSLAQNNTLSGFDIQTSGATTDGIEDGGGSVGNLFIRDVSISGSGQAVDIDQGGNLDVVIDSLTSTGSRAWRGPRKRLGNVHGSAGSISGSGNTAFQIGNSAGGAGTGGTATISYGGTIRASGSTRAVDIHGRAAGAGNIDLSGDITQSGGGATGVYMLNNAGGIVTFSGDSISINPGTGFAVNLLNNTGATINFRPGIGSGLDITTTSGTGFRRRRRHDRTSPARATRITTATGQIVNMGSGLGRLQRRDLRLAASDRHGRATDAIYARQPSTAARSRSPAPAAAAATACHYRRLRRRRSVSRRHHGQHWRTMASISTAPTASVTFTTVDLDGDAGGGISILQTPTPSTSTAAASADQRSGRQCRRHRRRQRQHHDRRLDRQDDDGRRRRRSPAYRPAPSPSPAIIDASGTAERHQHRRQHRRHDRLQSNQTNLSTGANTAVDLTNNAGATINFTRPAGLDIATTPASASTPPAPARLRAAR